MSRYQPVVNSVVGKFRTFGVSTPALRAKANAQLIKALKTYDPGRGTVPTTHIWNNLQKVKRIAGESLQSGHIPEYRSVKKATFTTIRDNLTDRYGREPNVKEMSEELGWSQKETSRMNSELGNEVSQSKLEFESFGSADAGTIKDKALADYLYHEIKDRDKVIFEHTFGYGGKEILKNKDLARKLNTNEMAIHRAKEKLASKIRSFR